MNGVQYCFTQGTEGMQVSVSYDTGWNKSMQCGGVGGWEDEIELNENDAAMFRIRNCRTGGKVSVCGIKWLRGMTFSAIFVGEPDHKGFIIEQDDNSVTVTCYGPSSLEYTPAQQSATC
jgi:hypothetical protein